MTAMGKAIAAANINPPKGGPMNSSATSCAAAIWPLALSKPLSPTKEGRMDRAELSVAVFQQSDQREDHIKNQEVAVPVATEVASASNRMPLPRSETQGMVFRSSRSTSAPMGRTTKNLAAA